MSFGKDLLLFKCPNAKLILKETVISFKARRRFNHFTIQIKKWKALIQEVKWPFVNPLALLGKRTNGKEN